MTQESFIAEACSVLYKDLDSIQSLVEKLINAPTTKNKIEILSEFPLVQEFVRKPLFEFLSYRLLSDEEELVVKSVAAIGQVYNLFSFSMISEKEKSHRIKQMLSQLVSIEKFYSEIGGLIGYHLTMVQYLCRPIVRFQTDHVSYRSPCCIDISESTPSVAEAIHAGIEHMDKLGEIYPVGGAADRLRLFDPQTAEALPAAMLSFCGKTLLERLVCDVQAKEYLYYKFYGKQLRIPIAMMTSKEKANHERVVSLCEDNQWFQRRKEDFFFFCQPSVPTLDREGNWALQGEMQLLLRPGGHGVIWKLARDEGAFEMFRRRGVSKALVRQINNPIASEDYGLIAFSGIGLKQDHKMGFCSCDRQVKSAEGTNVLIEERVPGGFVTTLTNIEYCDFQKYHIADEPVEKGSAYSKFPSNTNLLFVDLDAIEEAIKKAPIPGMIVNLKKMVYNDESGALVEKELARLESTMQNVADCFSVASKEPIKADDYASLRSYITYNYRRKTISATKREYTIGTSLLETPEGCFIDMMHNAKGLLESYCGYLVPQREDLFGTSTPAFLFFYHPALGPLYSIIGQKLRGGSLKQGSELQLHIADIDMELVDIEGSLMITTNAVMGHLSSEGVLDYSDRSAKCTLHNVKVKNKGIDYQAANVFWKNEIVRNECCEIILDEGAELVARSVTLPGDLKIRVEKNTRLTIEEEEGNLIFHTEWIKGPSWTWRYCFAQDHTIRLEKQKK